MKHTLLLLFALALLGCGAGKQLEKQIGNGMYDTAIDNAVHRLRTNKDAKRKGEYALLLQKAYDKANKRDLTRIDYLKQDSNPENLERIFELYNQLKVRQERIQPVLPVYNQGQEVRFSFHNYNRDVVSYKRKSSEYLYGKATSLLNSNDKLDVRQAFNDFQYIEKINPNFQDVRELTKVALLKGRDYIFIQLKNRTRQAIPDRLETDLLNISTYGLNDIWTEYHNRKDRNVKYDYDLTLYFKDIVISPEQIKERQITKESQVKDGYKYTLDSKGNVKKDTLGNDIKTDKYKTVRCDYYETRQFKTATIIASAEFKDLATRQLIDKFPIESNFLFEHFYATSNGDNRALDTNLLDYLNNKRVQFPSNEQMIFDAGEDLKIRLKSIITGLNF